MPVGQSLCTAHDAMVSWDVAERTLDSLSNSCRGELQAALERPSPSPLTPVCRTEVGSLLGHQSRGEELPQKTKGDGQRVKSVPIQDEGIGPESSPAGAHPAHPATIVLSFVMCALVVFAAIGYYVSGGGGLNGRQPTRHDKRLHKKKNDRPRERGKKRR